MLWTCVEWERVCVCVLQWRECVCVCCSGESVCVGHQFSCFEHTHTLSHSTHTHTNTHTTPPIRLPLHASSPTQTQVLSLSLSLFLSLHTHTHTHIRLSHVLFLSLCHTLSCSLLHKSSNTDHSAHLFFWNRDMKLKQKKNPPPPPLPLTRFFWVRFPFSNQFGRLPENWSEVWTMTRMSFGLFHSRHEQEWEFFLILVTVVMWLQLSSCENHYVRGLRDNWSHMMTVTLNPRTSWFSVPAPHPIFAHANFTQESSFLTL